MVQVYKGRYASKGEGEYVPNENAESRKPPNRVLKWADGGTDRVLLDDLALGGEWGGEREEREGGGRRERGVRTSSM